MLVKHFISVKMIFMKTPIYIIRMQLGMSQAAFAKHIGIDQAHLSRLELNKIKVSPEKAAAIVTALDGRLTEEHLLYPERFDHSVKFREPKKKLPPDWQLVRKKLTPEQVKAAQEAAEQNLTVGNLWNAFLKSAPKHKAFKE
jgi:transcriptional regulator with XRE-family HTH domain